MAVFKLKHPVYLRVFGVEFLRCSNCSTRWRGSSRARRTSSCCERWSTQLVEKSIWKKINKYDGMRNWFWTVLILETDWRWLRCSPVTKVEATRCPDEPRGGGTNQHLEVRCLDNICRCYWKTISCREKISAVIPRLLLFGGCWSLAVCERERERETERCWKPKPSHEVHWRDLFVCRWSKTCCCCCCLAAAAVGGWRKQQEGESTSKTPVMVRLQGQLVGILPGDGGGKQKIKNTTDPGPTRTAQTRDLFQVMIIYVVVVDVHLFKKNR